MMQMHEFEVGKLYIEPKDHSIVGFNPDDSYALCIWDERDGRWGCRVSVAKTALTRDDWQEYKNPDPRRPTYCKDCALVLWGVPSPLANKACPRCGCHSLVRVDDGGAWSGYSNDPPKKPDPCETTDACEESWKKNTGRLKLEASTFLNWVGCSLHQDLLGELLHRTYRQGWMDSEKRFQFGFDAAQETT
jgi:hypothetical protein